MLDPTAVLQHCPEAHATDKSPVKPQAVQTQDRQVAPGPGHGLLQLKTRQEGNKAPMK